MWYCFHKNDDAEWVKARKDFDSREDAYIYGLEHYQINFKVSNREYGNCEQEKI